MNKLSKLQIDVKKILKRGSGSHDWEHTERVLDMCVHIMSIEGGDMETIHAAALLHDIGRHAQDKSKGKVSHSLTSADMAIPLLKKYNFSQESVKNILHCIKTHSYRKGDTPKTLEAQILFDADKLDAIGAIGIGRAFVFAGENKAAVHIKNLNVENSKSYTKQDTAYREYKIKLEKIKDRIYTDEGKRIAEERHAFMVVFFNRLIQEANGEL